MEATPTMPTVPIPALPTVTPSRPTREHVDVFGLSDAGRVRGENQDHFLVASLHKVMQVHQTSLPADETGPLVSPSRGWVFLVADGLGGIPGGRQASTTALRAIADYVTHTMDLYTSLDAAQEEEYLAELRRSVELSHEVVRAEGERDEERTGMATTLTMVTVRWPRAYLIHVGDSRCYRLRGGKLDKLTRDQTMAQAMLDAGALSADQAEQSRFKHILYSALGGREVVPDAASTDIQWDDVWLLCTDGLTKHVSDVEIGEHLARPETAEITCRRLVDLALERGGSDNVTVVVGRLKR